MKLPYTEIDGELLITNISEYVSIGDSIANIEINYQMPKYSFSPYEIPSYLFIDDINTNDDRSILIFDGLSLQSDKGFSFHQSQGIENIIFLQKMRHYQIQLLL